MRRLRVLGLVLLALTAGCVVPTQPCWTPLDTLGAGPGMPTVTVQTTCNLTVQTR